MSEYVGWVRTEQLGVSHWSPAVGVFDDAEVCMQALRQNICDLSGEEEASKFSLVVLPYGEVPDTNEPFYD